jgi:hypothetical protein
MADALASVALAYERKFSSDVISVPKRIDECEFPPCQSLGMARTIVPFSDAPHLTVRLCDAHLDCVLQRTMDRPFIDWLVSRVWP